MHFYTPILKKYPFLQRYYNLTKLYVTVLFFVPSETFFSLWFSVHKIYLFWPKNALSKFYMTTRVDISCINFFHIFSFQKMERSFQPCLARPFLSPPKQNINKQKLYCKYAKNVFESFFCISLSVHFKFCHIPCNTLESYLKDEKLMSPPKRQCPLQNATFENAT